MLNKSEDFFSKIREFDHTLGVYLTYLLDNEVIQKIRENSSGRTVILHDYRHGINLEDNLKSRILCIPSMPKLSNDTNCFHAKAALLKGRDRARLVIGSMNLVKEAFSAPKEIACSLDLGYESGLYRTVLEFLCQVRCRSSQWTAVLKELDIRPPKLPKKEDSTIRFIWNSHGCSIAEEVASRHAAFYNGQKPILRVVSPFLPKDYDSSFDNFYDQVQVEEFHLYLRAKTPLPPRIKVRSGTRIYSPRKSSSGYFHGKAVMLDYGDRALLYIGSANFTNHGFFWNLGQGANQECGLILTLNRKSQMTQILD